ncbi:hypothetical protein A2631_01845 [Candidatus Daviesbacteria bacterium RIFCSPHIGHO2_01_FULL_44_29]|uniref:DNA polymerase IV n=1 Tax=Candidatus Daviesbacteria bacterium RIFCSPHIGHO2_02_FULL_43_12 TaxID=1797776 RepID=A0A1F5KJR8_9BACT|nr:MAG: hypothetical protein A2631_01845 [Candidatus Daviesbacteria bacterium RIFCSPHIGHO2_01_FULL_44_29]OGE41142.1 MAG: hypothetical protein A3D25_01240 [Candidatus Daviesbacteria bacterium RIFCSPHIGHO2_02_FULL_43_12]OGE69341.1 MAG: hypothetical protein A3B55_02980 [Candidatus Daviesbacteria bacterium RIFCSPLOWO2_01_FULL_43_15]
MNPESYIVNRIIVHIDFNSFFATVEQQANPRLRGKPIGVTGGDRTTRTVLGAASVEAKKFGVRTGMQIWEARQLCPELILVNGDSDKYLDTTQKFLNILKDYSPYLEVFSIDECFLELTGHRGQCTEKDNYNLLQLATEIKSRIRAEIGEWITCSIGISYNKLMAKLAGSLYKPDGLVMIADQEAAQWILDRVELDEICGIGYKTKKRLLNMGVTNFKSLRQASKQTLMVSFKSYGEVLFNYARGIDPTPIVPFYQKPEVKSVGHRHTLSHDTESAEEVKQIFLKITELISRKLRHKKLVGETVSMWFRYAFAEALEYSNGSTSGDGLALRSFSGRGMQLTIAPTSSGLEIFQAAWQTFLRLWNKDKIRMVGVSVSNLTSAYPRNRTFLEDRLKEERILQALDKVNDRYGEFTLQRAVLLGSAKVSRKPNPFLADRRFKL